MENQFKILTNSGFYSDARKVPVSGDREQDDRKKKYHEKDFEVAKLK